MTAPTFGLPPPLAPSTPPVPPAQPPVATPEPGPPRRLTVVLPGGSAPTPVDPNARPGGLPFAPKPGGQNDPNKR